MDSQATTHKRFAYGYDANGVYTGLVYKNEFGLFPNASTIIKPDFIEGCLPIWNNTRKQWIQTKKEDLPVIKAKNQIEKTLQQEVIEKIDNAHNELNGSIRILHQENSSLSDKILETKRVSENRYEAIVQKIDALSVSQANEKLALSYRFDAIKEYLELQTHWREEFIKLFESLNKKTFWQRLKYLITGDFNEY